LTERASGLILPDSKASVEQRPDITIIGPGKVGRAIATLAARAGYRIAAVAGRDAARTRQIAGLLGPDVKACSAPEAARAAGLVLLTVPDDAIERVCRKLADAGAFRAESVVAHCSGALSSDALLSAREQCGCAVGSMHPLQTFPSPGAAAERFGGTYCFCEGDERALGELEALAKAIGGVPVRIAKESKPLYHAAAVMACNYLAALLDAAVALAEQAGVDRSTYLRAMAPIVRATVENVFASGPEAALTGPIARGDAETVRRHLEAMANVDARLDGLYRAAGEWTVELAKRKGTIDARAAQELPRVLAENTRKGASHGGKDY